MEVDTLPRWIAASLEIKEGRDPLGLQTTTQDRLMALLLPGVFGAGSCPPRPRPSRNP
jgi:hypothetical protein